MIQQATDVRSSLRRRWPPIVWIGVSFLALTILLAGLIALSWRSLGRASTPDGLFELAVDVYAANPQLKPFSTSWSDGSTQYRLFGLTESEAQTVLRSCPLASWRKIGLVEKDYSDDPEFHLWECDAGSALLRGRVMWDPSLGLDGVAFSGCRKPDCPDAGPSFDTARSVSLQSPEPSA